MTNSKKTAVCHSKISAIKLKPALKKLKLKLIIEIVVIICGDKFGITCSLLSAIL